MINNKKITEKYIIKKYLQKLNFNKKETFNFTNDASFLKIPLNKKVIITNDSIVESVDFFKVLCIEFYSWNWYIIALSDLLQTKIVTLYYY